MPPALLWFRRDLRLMDHPALLAAAGDGPVLAVFVLDEALLRPAGSVRIAFLLASLRALDATLRERGGGLVVRHGPPDRVIPALAAEVGASTVHVSADFGPYGRMRDSRVAVALGRGRLLATGSPYAVAPGRITTTSGGTYRVFTPFYRAWLAHGWRRPASPIPDSVRWAVAPGIPIPPAPALPPGTSLPEAGETAAARVWRRFRTSIEDYARDRDRPDLDGTSRLSPHLKVGAIHPRTLLAGLGPGDDEFRRQLAWREFYAAVLHSDPESAREYVKPEMRRLPYATGALAAQRLDAWKQGRTGYPLVDAGMRQLLAEGWVHNRVRMIVASFLVKDLHVEWTDGARHFMRHLADADLASNQHGWQWAAGTGTDAAPFFRIFNPTTQAERYDPDGTYIRRWIPELVDLRPPEVHKPWLRPSGPPSPYPGPIVDHDEERVHSLAAYRSLARGAR